MRDSRRGNLRVVLAFPTRMRGLAVAVMLAVVATSCTPEAVTGSAERGTSPDDDAATAVPTVADLAELEPGVVIAPPPTPDGPRPFVVATILGETDTVMGPLDGPAVAGVVAEIERLNDEGGLLGRPIELLRFDSQSRVSLAERQAARLADDPPDLIITSCDTDFSEPVLDIARDAGIITISPCADDERYLNGELGSRNYTMGSPAMSRGALAAAVAIANYGDTALVLRDVTSPEALAFCDGFEREFRELGGSVVYRDEFSYDTLEPVQDRLIDFARPTAFITVCSHVPGGNDAAPSIIALLRTLGLSAPIVAGSSVDEQSWFADVPTLGEMTFISWSSAFGNDPDDRVNQLVRRVQQNGETQGAGVSTILGAEAVEAWARAVERARSDEPDRVAAALASFSNESFSTGDISFVGGARMDDGRMYRVLRVVDGELSVMSTEEVEGSP